MFEFHSKKALFDSRNIFEGKMELMICQLHYYEAMRYYAGVHTQCGGQSYYAFIVASCASACRWRSIAALLLKEYRKSHEEHNNA